MTTAELRHMRMLINRYHEACFNVERAMARATRCAPVLTFMPKGGMNEGILENGMGGKIRDKRRIICQITT